MCSVRLEEYHEIILQSQRLQWLCHLERMKEDNWHIATRKFVVGDNFAKSDREPHRVI